MKLKSGYAYQLEGVNLRSRDLSSSSAAWAQARRASDERWEIVMYTPRPGDAASYLGSRLIDGALCAVFLTTRGIFAQTEVAARGGKGRKAPGPEEDLDEWANAFAQKIGSALDAWLDESRVRQLRRLVAAGGQVKSRVFEISHHGERSYSDIIARLKRQLKPQGWRLFADEDNYDQG